MAQLILRRADARIIQKMDKARFSLCHIDEDARAEAPKRRILPRGITLSAEDGVTRVIGSRVEGRGLRMGNDKVPHWQQKIPQAKIRLLYEQDARGIIDEEMIDEVGWALWERCDSILKVTAAHHGQVICPCCGADIELHDQWAADAIIACPSCDWRLPWAAYHRSYRGKQLFGANAVSIFKEYHSAFALARKVNEKMLLIDWLIHSFHASLQGIGRPVAANLIEGSLGEVIHFLDQLTSGEKSASGIGDSLGKWRNTISTAEWAQIFVDREKGSVEDSTD